MEYFCFSNTIRLCLINNYECPIDGSTKILIVHFSNKPFNNFIKDLSPTHPLLVNCLGKVIGLFERNMLPCD